MKRLLALALVLFACVSCTGRNADNTEKMTSAPESVTETAAETEAETEAETFPDYTAEPPEEYEDTLWTEYKRLPNTEKNLYLEIYDSVLSDSSIIDNDEMCNILRFRGDIDIVSVKKAASAVIWDHPELFFLNGNFYCRPGTDKYGDYQKLKIYRTVKPDKIPEMEKKLEKAVELVVTKAEKRKTDLEKALFVHDYLVKNCVYDTKAADAFLGNSPDEPYGKDLNLSFTAYGCLVNNKAVCEGYAEAYQIILNRLGIPCGRVTAMLEDIPHVLNWVMLDGRYSYVDVTNDDVPYELNGNKYNEPFYAYFGVSEDWISATHSDIGYDLDTDIDMFVPECDTMEHNPVYRKGLCFDAYDFATLKDAADRSVNSMSTYFDVIFESKEEYEKAEDELFAGKIFNLQASKGATYVNGIYFNFGERYNMRIVYTK